MNEIWRADIRRVPIAEISNQLTPVLSASEHVRLAGLTRAHRRAEYLLSRAMIRSALSKHYRRALGYWQLQETQNAPPTLLNPIGESLYLSLSHSAQCVMLAISEQPVGLDVEQIQADRPHKEIAKRVFTPAQQAALEPLTKAAAIHLFYQLWTCKEARVKIANPASEITMFSTATWEIDQYFNRHAQFTDYYATILSQIDTRLFKQIEFRSFKEFDITSIF